MVWLLVALRDRYPVPWGVAMLAPLYQPVELVGAGRFTLWCAVVGLWLWFDGREPARESISSAASSCEM